LLTLSPRQRSILVLHEVYDLTCDEIGHILGISRDAVKMSLWRAREAFRATYLQEDGR
jgi:RNA polymerase sigma-70 factor, ECF subfamily